MAYKAMVLFLLVNVGWCIYALSRSVWKSIRDGGFTIGKPPRRVMLRLNRGEYISQMALWVLMLAVLLALFFVFALNLSGRDGFALWLNRFFLK
jgi:hypothetical protein